MRQQSHQHVWDWYKQFSHPPGYEDDREARNFFRRVTPAELSEFKREFELALPQSYERFLLEIGTGYLKQDAASKITISHYNEFVSLPEMAAILRKETVEWQVYPEFIDEGEIPFFMEAANSVFVIDPADGEIHFPFLKERKYADTFEEFIAQLMAECEFFIPAEYRYENLT